VVNLSSSRFDYTQTGMDTWAADYERYDGAGVYFYKDNDGNLQATQATKTINEFFIDRAYQISCYNGGDDSNNYCNMSVEFLDSADNVVAALQTNRNGAYTHTFKYGASLASLVLAPKTGAYPQTDGILTFDNDTLYYEGRDGVSSGVYTDFSFSCDMASVAKIRFSNVRVGSGFDANATGQVFFRLTDAYDTTLMIG
jgi:hypothetical protein